MTKMEEHEHNKRPNLFKALKTSDNNISKSSLQRKRIDVQPIVHNKHKIIDLKYKDNQLLKRNEQPSCSSLKKMPLKKACELKNQITFSEIKKSKIETMTNMTDDKNTDGGFQEVGLYEIKSYQLVEVSKKQAELTTTNKPIHNMDMSRKAAKQAAKFFHLAKIHKGKQLSNPYMKFVNKVTRKPLKAVTKSKLPNLENGEQLQEMFNCTGIGVSTQTEKSLPLLKTFNELMKKNALFGIILILMIFNILLWFTVAHDNNCEEVGRFSFAQAIYRFCNGS